MCPVNLSPVSKTEGILGHIELLSTTSSRLLLCLWAEVAFVVRDGFEPPTQAFSGPCSTELSYLTRYRGINNFPLSLKHITSCYYD